MPSRDGLISHWCFTFVFLLARLSRRSLLSSAREGLAVADGCRLWFRLRLDMFCPSDLLGFLDFSASRTIVGYETGLSLGMAVASWFGMRRGSVWVWLVPVGCIASCEFMVGLRCHRCPVCVRAAADLHLRL